MEVKSKLSRLYRWEYFWLCLIVITTLAMHFFIINNPSELILDEQHYVRDARSISVNHTTERAEHPPLGKLIIVSGMEIFGDNPMGWRFFSVSFGTASIILFYFLCRRLDMSRIASSIATFLLAFENMTFLQNSIAMLDVFFVTFMMAAFLLYISRRYIASGVAIGLSGLTKLSGALAGAVVFSHWVLPFIGIFFRYFYRRFITSKITFGLRGLCRLMGVMFKRRKRSWWFFLAAIFAVIIFLEVMIPLDFAISRDFSGMPDPLQRTRTMMSLSGSLTYTHVDHISKSRPWEWLISYKPMAYYILPHYTAAISFTIWALTIPTFGYMIWRALKKNNAALFGLSWFAGTFLMTVLLVILTDRVTYIFYFYPVVGSVCIGLALALSQLLDVFHKRPSGKLKWTALVIVIVVLFLHLASFLILSPLIPVDFAKMVGITG